MPKIGDYITVSGKKFRILNITISFIGGVEVLIHPRKQKAQWITVAPGKFSKGGFNPA